MTHKTLPLKEKQNPISMTSKVVIAPPFAILARLAHSIALYFAEGTVADKDKKVAEREKNKEYGGKKRKKKKEFSTARTLQ